MNIEKEKNKSSGWGLFLMSILAPARGISNNKAHSPMSILTSTSKKNQQHQTICFVYLNTVGC